MTPHWQQRDVPLKFGVGDWTMFSVPVRLHVRGVRLAEREPAVADPAPPTVPELGDAKGYMMRAMPVVEALPMFARSGGYLRYVTQQYTHCFIDLSLGAQAYRAGFSSKTRSTIGRKVRKFQEHCGGALKWQTYRDAAAMREFHGLARKVSAKSYQERLLDAGIPDADGFVAEMVRLAERDQVRGWVLFDGERPVSYLYCPVQDGVLIYQFLGYDPEYAKHSVGTVLQWLALEQLFEEARFDIFDFTEGESDHKRLFATHQVRCANIIFLRPSLGLSLLARAHAAAARSSTWLGELAGRLGLRTRLRRLLRFGLAGAR